VTRGVLVAGIGNIFLSDDGFGVEVGIRGVHLAYELLDGFDGLILVDAVPMSDAPGTVAVIAPQEDGSLDTDDVHQGFDAHSMGPEVVLGTLARLGGTVDQIFVVGCQPACLDEGMGLSPTVERAVDDAVELCRRLALAMVTLVGKETIR
jgi:hydrogenase maturation protease